MNVDSRILDKLDGFMGRNGAGQDPANDSNLRLLRNKVLGSVANAGICPMSLRLLLLRLCGWRIAPGTHLFSARFLNGQIQVGESGMIAPEVFLHDRQAPG